MKAKFHYTRKFQSQANQL